MSGYHTYLERVEKERDKAVKQLAVVTLERDQLRAKLAEYDSLLCECEDYFDNRADADMDQDGYIPNDEMKLLTSIRSRKGGKHE